MRILDNVTDTSLDEVILYFTLAEAKAFLDIVNALLEEHYNNHAHLPTEKFEKELTVCIYDPDRLEGLN